MFDWYVREVRTYEVKANSCEEAIKEINDNWHRYECFDVESIDAYPTHKTVWLLNEIEKIKAV